MRTTVVLGLFAAFVLAGSWAATAAAPAAGIIAVDKVGNTIRFLDPVTLKETGKLAPPGKSVHELSVAPDGKRAFIPLYGEGIYGSNKEPNNKILVIDLAKQEIAQIIDLGMYVAPHGLAATRDGKVWITCDQQNVLLLVDPAKNAVEAAYPVPGRGAHFVVLTPDETKLYISNKEGPVAVFDLKARTFKTGPHFGKPGVTAGAGAGTEGLAMSPDGRRLVIADNDTSSIHLIDTATDKAVDAAPLANAPLQSSRKTRLIRLRYSPDGRTIVATTYAGAETWIIDAANIRRQMMTPVAKGPQGVAFDPDGKSVVVSSHDSGLLTRIDLKTGKPIATADGGDGIEVLSYY